MNKKIRIFIGSSTESLKVASAIKTNFEYDNHIEVRIWNESIFQPGQYTFDELIRFTKSYDFAIFVWANDDKVAIESRGIMANQPRDNVILEAGMFYRALGRERVFLFAPVEDGAKIPSDLQGLSPIRYKTPTDDNYRSELSSGVDFIKVTINKLGIIKPDPFKPIVFFSQENRPPETHFSKLLNDTKKFYFMSRTGITLFSKYNEFIKRAIDNGCECRFIVLNQSSLTNNHGQSALDYDKINTDASYLHLKNLKAYGWDKVKIRVMNHCPTFGFDYFEKNNGEKIELIQTNFIATHRGADRPIFIINKEEHPQWFQIFYDEFKEVWEKSQEWGRTRRIIIDGAPGAGKTTLLTGMSPRDELKRETTSITSWGYTVFCELITQTISNMRQNGIGDPTQDWGMFFNLAVDLAIDYYRKAETNLISFYDRGIFYLEIMAERLGCIDNLPKKYFEFINENRYDDPVFIMHPILSHKVTPHKGDSKARIYTNEERVAQHSKIVSLYKKYGYRVIELPVYMDDFDDNIKKRLSIIKKEIGI